MSDRSIQEIIAKLTKAVAKDYGLDEWACACTKIVPKKIDDPIKEITEKYGKTENPFSAGFITPDGSMLNFSDEGHGGQRTMDHREVSYCFEIEQGEITKGLWEFMDLGAIRLHIGSYGRRSNQTQVNLNLIRGRKPTPEQVDTAVDIVEYLTEVYGERPTLIVDAMDIPTGEVLDIEFKDDARVRDMRAALRNPKLVELDEASKDIAKKAPEGYRCSCFRNRGDDDSQEEGQ